MSALRFESIHHAFGRDPLMTDLSLAIEAGALTCLLGPSGCGKTTLLRIAAGLEPLQRGRILLGDRVLADPAAGIALPPEDRGIGLMFQDYALFPHLTVRRNVLFGVPASRTDRRDWADRALGRVGLAAFGDIYPHTLSGGQQQRVALLRALAPEPRVLLLDEPFSGLDATLRIQVREETLGLLKDTGVTTLMVTHDPEEAMFMADRIVVMDRGRIAQIGSPSETYLHPNSAFVAELFGPVNRLSGRVTAGTVETPLGRFAAPGLPEGSPAEVLIRPEAVSLEVDGMAAQVTAARLLGRSTHLRLTLDGAAAAHLQARISGTFEAGDDAKVRIRIDHKQAFVFPAG